MKRYLNAKGLSLLRQSLFLLGERLSITSYKMAFIYVITVFFLISHNILNDASRATEVSVKIQLERL